MRELVKLTAANLHHSNDLIRNLEVDTKRMQQNLNRAN
jgi:adenylosuccinate lyase